MNEGDTVLVTGGGGFIGSHFIQRLANDHDVRVLDDFSTGARENVSFLPDEAVISGSVTDESVVKDAVRGVDIVVHFAAMMGVQRTLEHPREVLAVNIDGTRNVLRAAGEADIDRVLVASTSEVYGDAPDPPYAEDDMTAPKTNYAVSKVTDERFTAAFAEEYGFDYTIVRYFNVYGPRQESSEKGYVVPIFLRRALDGDDIEVHGTGDQTRDFTYINDAVDCTYRTLGEAGRNEIFNVGTGIETSITALANEAADLVPHSAVEHVDHPRPYIVRQRCADVSKARDRLGYEPEYSLREGLRQTKQYLDTN
jgi:UDP-glucose 4-epimerase